MRIDAHQHFWRYTPAEYGWIDDSMSALRRDFLPADLALELKAAKIDGAIAVQARQTVEETEWLLSLAAENEFLRGVVGWAPLVDPAVEETIARLAAHPKLRALRHVVQDEPDDRYILRDDFNRGVDVAGRYGLAYDILIFERHLPQAIEFVDRHPDMVLIVDHVAKPRIREGLLEPWRTNIRELARRPNVYCKISGMVTEADWACWTVADFSAVHRHRARSVHCRVD